MVLFLCLSECCQVFQCFTVKHLGRSAIQIKLPCLTEWYYEPGGPSEGNRHVLVLQCSTWVCTAEKPSGRINPMISSATTMKRP